MGMFGLEKWLGTAKGGNVSAIKQVKRNCSALAEQQRRTDTMKRQQKDLDQAHQQEVAKLYRPEFTWEQNTQLEAALDAVHEGLEWQGQLTREDLLDDQDLATAHAMWESCFESRLTAYMNEVLREKPQLDDLPKGSLAADWYGFKAAAAEAEDAAPEEAEDLVASARQQRKKTMLGNTHVTWVQHRAPLIFMMLHPKIWGSFPDTQKTETAAGIIGVNRTAVYNWIAIPNLLKKTKKECVIPAWFDLVDSMTWGTLKQHAKFHSDLFEPFNSIMCDTDTVREQLSLGRFTPSLGRFTLILNRFKTLVGVDLNRFK